jgi:putative transposase
MRLQGYDYSGTGAYFVTICAQNRKCLFGDIVDGKMIMNDLGRIVADEWRKSAEIRRQIELDEFVVMPNHFHGIVFICGSRVVGTGRADAARKEKGTARRAPTDATERFGKSIAGSLPTIMRSFKSAATRRVNQIRRAPGHKLWQRNYYEHIIRNENELNRIQEYIRHNPLNWKLDRENPNALRGDG